ncbi:uncharacterized protein LOC113170907 isoform X2 [Anabas testudineus]|uniref:uncharacterized protein LOC113170907 isoform X2 n=1 Tax=Anabas testudineus TaxID=64144 RepID=UPI000E460B43|nr:uncharacterized protein LOC113170907 isoform X2 [Anabas testudineus]
MSVTVAKDKEVTEVTIKSDSKSMFAPLCQILAALCYSPMCRTVNRELMQSDVTAALGTIQIMLGLFNIGLGPGRTSTHPMDLTDLRAAYWLGAVYILTGITTLFSGRFPSACLVGANAFVNIVGAIFAAIGIGLYAVDLTDASVVWMCNEDVDTDNCRNVAFFAQRLLTGMDITLIVVAVLQMCVCISLAVLSIRALVIRKEEKVGGDFDIYKPILKEVMTSPGA